MPLDPHIARDISYASSAQTRGGRAMIRALENTTGRMRLMRRAQGYGEEVAQGADFWEVMVHRYGIAPKIIAGSFANIPKEGPLILVSNHPFGILDGLMMGLLLSRLRGDFRILANQVFRRAEELNRVILPISFDTDKAAITQNLATRRAALDYLGQGGAIGVFPGGTVSTSPTPFGQARDPSWRSFTAKMIAKSQAQVVPIYFEGQNSRLFQIASHLHPTLRLGLLLSEFHARLDKGPQIAIGAPIPRADLAQFRTRPRMMMDFLREATYALSPSPLANTGYGYEFERRYKENTKSAERE
ncbi:MAG: lysophospholipid acyltransferase family protein [Paracoccaceae bacterium]